ncbi:type IV pilin protein [Pseudactinotalea terrae]|uniref:type IV pilin protein n=1 Tax=Pseudactinotalea terrae TaxID=1743262 RepID=UPI0012E195FB|nr:prepilin-type N-terminal cleavage/methylation domain-containing protein [Pseudactinotalea terrae]
MIARITQALNKKTGDKGFTLVELLVTIVIIGILTAIAVPAFMSQRDKGYDAAVKSDLKNAALSAETNYVDLLTYTDANVFAEGLQADAEIASDGTRYAAWADEDSYVIYGLSRSGNIFVLDSEGGGTPVQVEDAAVVWTTGDAPTGTDQVGTATQTWAGATS